jgi:hypothetical protein
MSTEHMHLPKSGTGYDEALNCYACAGAGCTLVLPAEKLRSRDEWLNGWVTREDLQRTRGLSVVGAKGKDK